MEQFVIPNQDVVAEYLDNMPIARVGTVEDVARVVCFLAGPDSTWITGQAIGVDGGHSLRRGPRYDAMMRPILGEEAWRLVKGDDKP
jgi:enoyl-[acyl-carrier-protein] reductase (NADH)